MTVLNCYICPNFTVGAARTEQGSQVKIFDSIYGGNVVSMLIMPKLFNDISSVANHFCQKRLVSSRRERTQQAILKVHVNGKKPLLQIEKKVSNSFRASMGEIRVFDWFTRSIRDVSDNDQMSNMSAKTIGCWGCQIGCWGCQFPVCNTK